MTIGARSSFRVNARQLPFESSFLQWSHLLGAPSLLAHVRGLTNDATDLHINRDLPSWLRYGSVMAFGIAWFCRAALISLSPYLAGAI